MDNVPPERGSGLDQLLQEAQAGSSEALGRLLQSLRPYLLLIANEELDPRLRTKAGASDLVQDTFLDAQRDFGHFKGRTRSEFFVWLRQILVHNMLNVTRDFCATQKREISREVSLGQDESSESTKVALPAEAASMTPHERAVAREQLLRLNDALLRLPDEYRQVISLRHLERRSFKEIGDLMGKGSEAVRKLWIRAIQRLRLELDDSDLRVG